MQSVVHQSSPIRKFHPLDVPIDAPMGAFVEKGGSRFRVWAPAVQSLCVVLEADLREIPMRARGGGWFEAFVPGIGAGSLYRYRLSGLGTYPDPASRYQPQGVHGPSMVIDASAFVWSDQDWTGVAQQDLVFYELHVGTFSPLGTFAGVQDKLQYLQSLGVTALELMPLSDFPGRWNWGYDPAAFYAPCRAYGTPDDLRSLVNEAHRLGLAVFLDVVYNHVGPAGAYVSAYNPYLLSRQHLTTWGPAVNLDGEGSAGVRSFFIQNALHWLEEYHMDGLRLDATSSLYDDSPKHFLKELAERVHALPGRKRLLMAEDHRNMKTLVAPWDHGGYGLDGLWVDDFHHQVRCTLTGESEGYYCDYPSSAEAIAKIISEGWLFAGQFSKYGQAVRGTDPSGVLPEQLVYFIQNHDQVGNRALGDRLTARVSLPVYHAASALLLFAAQLPLLFMGQEWAAQTPFLYFTDHEPQLGLKISQGRKSEFRGFSDFNSLVADPQDCKTYTASCLEWSELDQALHAGTLALYRDMLALRRELQGPATARSIGSGGLVVERGSATLYVALQGDVPMPISEAGTLKWHSEQASYVEHPQVPDMGSHRILFHRAGAAVFIRT